MSEKLKCLLGDILFLVIGTGMYVYASAANYPVRTRGDVGSAFVPKLICLLIIVLSLIKIVMILANPRMSTQREKSENVSYGKGFAVIGVLAVYCAAFSRIGFLILTPLMLFLEMALMMPKEKRSPKKYTFIAVFSVISTIGVFVIFYYGLKLMLPAGLLKNIL